MWCVTTTRSAAREKFIARENAENVSRFIKLIYNKLYDYDRNRVNHYLLICIRYLFSSVVHIYTTLLVLTISYIIYCKGEAIKWIQQNCSYEKHDDMTIIHNFTSIITHYIIISCRTLRYILLFRGQVLYYAVHCKLPHRERIMQLVIHRIYYLLSMMHNIMS